MTNLRIAYRRGQIVAAIITIIIIAIGVCGNSLTVLALLKCARIRNVTAVFIICLCIADGLFCALVLPFHVSRYFSGDWIHVDVLCKLIPFLQYANVGLSLLFIAMITINRYVMIAHHTMYSKIYKPIHVTFMIIFCLLLSFGMQLPTLFGKWGEYKYDERLGTCSISKDARGNSSKTSLFIVAFAVPCIVIVCCYTRIFWVVHSSEKRIRKGSHPIHSSDKIMAKEMKRKRNEWRVTKMVLVIFVSFLVCYLPITIVKVLDKEVNNMNLHLVSYIMLYLSACINPIIYVIMNKQYRKAYRNVFRNNSCLFSRHFAMTAKERKAAEKPSKTIMSQVSVTVIPMNVINNKI